MQDALGVELKVDDYVACASSNCLLVLGHVYQISSIDETTKKIDIGGYKVDSYRVLKLRGYNPQKQRVDYEAIADKISALINSSPRSPHKWEIINTLKHYMGNENGESKNGSSK